jgi:hypothetical protein
MFYKEKNQRIIPAVMNKALRIFQTIVFCFGFGAAAQANINMGNGTVSTCGNYFYDSGGSGSNYGNNQHYVKTFYPDNGGGVYLNFYYFNSEQGKDFISIFNGPDTTSSLLYRGSGDANPGQFLSTHPSGALTVKFTSNGSVTNTGWEAYIGCNSPCSGPNTSTYIETSSNWACIGNPIGMQLSGSYQDFGLQFQWQSSSDTINWNDISNADSVVLVTNYAGQHLYRCRIICPFGPDTTYTSVRSVELVSGPCACVPPTPDTLGSCYIYYVNSNYAQNNIYNYDYTFGYQGYVNRRGLYVSQYQGQSFTLNVGINYSNQLNYSIFVDYNDDGSFDPNEHIGDYTTSDLSFTIPPDAPVGDHIFRIRAVDGNTGFASSACSATTTGETEDYTLRVLQGCSHSPFAGNIVSSDLDSSLCYGIYTSFNLDSMSYDSGYVAQWQISKANGPWENLAGEIGQSLSYYMDSVDVAIRCVVTCSASLETDTSSIGFLFAKPLASCYCTIPPANTVCSNWIERVTTNRGIVNIDNSSECDSLSYTNFTHVYASIEQADTLDLSVKMGNGPLRYGIWVDMNRNANFEYEERIAYRETSDLDSVSASWVVPASLNPGSYRMRVIVDNNYPYYGCTNLDIGEAEDYTIQVVGRPLCSSLPSSPSISATSNNLCPNVLVGLSLNGLPNQSGLHLQWLTSTDSVHWDTLTEDTNLVLSYYFSSSRYFQCAITCTATSESIVTPAYLVSASNDATCFCTPSTYNPCQMYISRIRTFGGTQNIDNSSVCSPSGYADFTDSLGVIQVQNDTIAFRLNASPNPMGFAGWIDYNDNADFENSEQIFLNYGSYTSEINLQFIVPADANPGTHRLRIKSDYYYYYPGNPCSNSYYGEVEDYSITILQRDSCTGVPSNPIVSSSINGIACPSNSAILTLSEIPNQSGISLQWFASSDSLVWDTLPGETYPSLSVNTTTTQYFYCQIQCNFNNTSIPSEIRKIQVELTDTCYCQPDPSQYGLGSYIAQVATSNGVTNFTNSSETEPTTYFNYSGSIGASQYQNDTLHFEFISGGDPNALNYSLFIDFNDNGLFDGEELAASKEANGEDSVGLDLILPANANPGTHKMRIRGDYYYVVNNPCDPYYLGETEDYYLQVLERNACAGVPANLSVQSSANPLCAGNEFSLNITGLPNENGYSFQWYSSANGSSWESLTGDTFPTLTDNLYANVNYFATISCENGGSLDSTTVFNQVLNNPTACYCTPSTSYSACYYSFISSVSTSNGVQNISNSSDCDSDSYTNYSDSIAVSQVRSQSFDLNLGAGGYPMYYSVWIDYDDNGEFDQSEQVVFSNNSSISTFTITIPNTTPVGMHRMRVRGDYSNNVYSPCDPLNYGETEDYTLTVLDQVACNGAPSAGNAVTSNAHVCASENFTLSLNNSIFALGYGYQWQSSADSLNWSDIANADTNTFTFFQNLTHYYRCRLVCSYSADTAYSSPVKVNISECINMFNGSTTTCDARFFDSGGMTGTYNNSEYFVHTFYPTIGSKIKIEWNSFASEGGYDYLQVFDGPSMSYNALISSSGSSTLPTVVSSHQTGALTVRFYSDYSVVNTGWDARISCVQDSACSGVPNSLSITSTESEFCGYGQPSLSVPIDSFGNQYGITLQWLKSEQPGGPYTLIPNSNSFTITPALTDTAYFICKAICSIGNDTVVSDEKVIFVSNVGDPSVYGQNVWKVHAYNAENNFSNPVTWETNYAGAFMDSSLNFISTNLWSPNTSPSNASGYVGCTVGSDLHSFSAKRKGFPCGIYQLSIPYYDDKAQLFINGTLVWSNMSCCQSFSNVWTGYLSATDSIEFRIIESYGQSIGILSFNAVDLTLSGPTSLCGNPSVQLGSNIQQGNETYLWSTGETSPEISVSSAGTYTVVTNYLGCSDTATYTVTEYTAPTVVAHVSQNPICAGTSVTLNGSGAVNYTWNEGRTNNVSFVPDTTTSYVVSGTDANGCVASDTVLLIVNPLPTLQTTVSNPVICVGSSTNLSVSGASSYTWYPGEISGSSISVSPNSSQVYTVYGTDANGCQSSTNTETITVNPAPSLSIDASPATTICEGSELTLTASGSSSDYQWSYDIQNNTAFVPSLDSLSYGLPTESALMLVGLHQLNPSYTGNAIRLRRSNDNAEMDFGFVNSALDLNAIQTWLGGSTAYCVTIYDQSGQGNNVSQGNNALQPELQWNVINGKPVVNYDPGHFLYNTTNFPSSYSVVAAAKYTAGTRARVISSVSNNWLLGWWGGYNDCMYGDGWVIYPNTIADDSIYTYSVTGTGSLTKFYKNGGLLAANSNGVSAPRGIQLNGYATSTEFSNCQILDVMVFGETLNNAKRSGAENAIAEYYHLPKSKILADYTVTGYSDLGCPGTLTQSIQIVPNPAVGYTITPDSIICGGQELSLSGVGAVSYTWSGGISNGENFVVSNNVSYQVTGTDANGCSNSDSAHITVLPLVNLTASSSDTTICIGDTVLLVGSGVSQYVWEPGHLTGDSVHVQPTTTTTYTLIGSNGLGCSDTVQLTIYVNPLPSVGFEIYPNDTICSGDSLQLNGTGAVSYVWTGGIANGNYFTPAVGSSYQVTGTDANGCSNSTTAYTEVGGLFTLSSSTTQEHCGQEDASASIQLTSGGPVSYQWDASAGNQTGASAQNLGAGTYLAIVSDLFGCSKTEEVQVSSAEPLQINLQTYPSNSVCAGTSVTLSASGASSYLWNHAVQNGISFLPVETNTYTVIGTDAFGCTDTIVQEIIVRDLPIVNVEGSDDSICGGASVVLTADGATSYVWSNGGGTNATLEVSPSATTTYTVTGIGANGCSQTATFQVAVFELSPLSITPSGSAAICYGDTLALEATSGFITYAWSNGGNLPTNSVYEAGFNTLTVTDGNGCSQQASMQLVVNSLPSVSVGSNSPVCTGSTLQLSGTGSGTYEWTGPNGFTSNLANPSIEEASSENAGSYTLTVTNTSGCVGTSNTLVSILSNHAPTLSFTGNQGFVNDLVSPSNSTPTAYYRFEVRYFDADGDLPASTYPRLQLDFEGNGSMMESNDRLFYMLPVNPSDLDVTDGKDYYFITTALAEGNTWKTSVVANDQGACSVTLGPLSQPTVLRDVDISIFANDISFSNPHPDPGTDITVFAVIHNYSGRVANNFRAHLVNQFDTTLVYPDVIIPSLSNLPTSNSVQVSWNITTPASPAWCPMQVFIDYGDSLSEPNELDNQAIRPFTNGNFTLPGEIIITAAPGAPLYPSNSAVSICGNAYYSGTAVQLTDSSCAGATVTATIVETGQTSSTYTNSQGNYCLGFTAPVTAGTYHVNVHITDFTLDGDTSTSFDVYFYQPPVCVAPDLVNYISLSGGTVNIPYSNCTGILAGQSLTGTLTVANIGNAASVAGSTVQINLPDGSPVPASFTVPALNPGETYVHDLGSMTFSYPVSTYISSSVDVNNTAAECYEYNNSSSACIVVLPPAPDLIPSGYGYGSAYQCQFNSISYRIDNSGGVASGPFEAKLYVYDGLTLVSTLTQTHASINPLQSSTVTFSYSPSTSGTYTFVLEVDEPNAITELSETNNTASTAINFIACKPDVYVFGCGSMDVKPTDPVAGSNITVYATVANAGQTTANGPFQVDFNVAGNHYTHVFNGSIASGSAQQVSIVVPAPAYGNNELTVTADYLNGLDEVNETNNSTSINLCWDFSLTNNACYHQYISNYAYVGHPVVFGTGMYNTGLYEASHAQVQFEVSGPGLSGWVNVGYASTFADITCSCPIGITLPGPFAFPQIGDYLIRITADFNNQYAECNESNNVLMVPVHVSDNPDYRVLSQYIAPSLLNPDLNESIVIDVTYENVGNGNLDSLEVYTQLDVTPHDSVRGPGLIGGFINTVHMTQTWSSDVRGVHIIRAVVDHDNEIAESNELNNEATRAIIVGQSPNLKFTSFATSTESPNANSLININATIKNNGYEEATATYQLYYQDNGGADVLIFQQGITLDTGESVSLSTPWLVADPRTVLIGRISNSNPVEYDVTDNEARDSIGTMLVSFNSSNASCATASNGIARAIVNGGQAPYVIQWSNGQSGDSLQTIPGTYAVTVTDAEGVNQSASVTIGYNVAPIVQLTSSASTVCAGDSVTLSASGMETYFWLSDSSTTNEIRVKVNETTQYSVIGTIAVGCPDTATVQITATPVPTWYADTDNDGFGNPEESLTVCEQPIGYVANSNDCNDENTGINSATVFYQDNDGDGFGGASAGSNCPSGQVVLIGGDCNDNNADINPNATEICNGIDDDCDGTIDEGGTNVFYRDADADGYGNPALTTLACFAPSGYVSDNTDCNDTLAAVNPGAMEICNNGIDDDCDGLVDEGCVTSRLLTNYCGITLSAISSYMSCLNIPGAQNYRYLVEDGSGFVGTYESPNNSAVFRLSFVSPSVSFQTTYSVRVAVRRDGVWGPYGTPCSVTTPPAPTPSVLPSSCGISIGNSGTKVYFSSIAGAVSYMVELTNSGLGYSQSVNTGNTNTYFSLSAFTGLSNGASYQVRVAAVTGAGVQAYGLACTITVDYTSKLTDEFCNYVLDALNRKIKCNTVTNASRYVYRVTGPNSYDQTWTSPDNSVYFKLSDVDALSPLSPSTVYYVSVAVEINGGLGSFGPACSVETPAIPTTALLPSYCGFTVQAPSTRLYFAAIPGADSYTIEVSNPGLAYLQIYNTGNASTYFSLSNFSGLKNGTSYSVRITAVMGGITGSYGSACNVIVDYRSALLASFCNITATSLNQKLKNNTVPGASNFVYTVTGPGGYNQTWTSPNNTEYFRLSYVNALSPLSPGTTYSIAVAVTMNGGTGSFGTVCTVTTPPLLKLEEQTTEVLSDIKVYPNPFTQVLHLEFENEIGSAEVCIRDMTGRVVFRTTTINNSLEVGDDLSKGIYLLTIQVGEERKEFKISKE